MLKRTTIALLLVLPAGLLGEARAEPVRLTDAELSATKAGFLDLYMIMPTVMVDQGQATTNTGTGSVSSDQHVGVDMESNISFSSPGSQTAFMSQTSTNGETRRVEAIMQQPVWVPWSQELRPLWYFGRAFAGAR